MKSTLSSEERQTVISTCRKYPRIYFSLASAIFLALLAPVNNTVGNQCTYRPYSYNVLVGESLYVALAALAGFLLHKAYMYKEVANAHSKRLESK